MMLLRKNSFPSSGLMVSALTMVILSGKLPVMSSVWSLFISLIAAVAASCSVTPVPGPVMTMSVTSLPFRSAAMFKLLVNLSSRYMSRLLLSIAFPGVPLIVRVLVTAACRAAASGESFIWNLNWHTHPPCSWVHGGTMPEHVPSSLQTYGRSPRPPTNTVSFPMRASNFPCFPISSRTSSRVAPAISITTNLFPARSVAPRILRSASP